MELRGSATFEEDDAQLVRRCLDGDREAFEPLAERYAKVLYNVAYRMTGDREDARDIAQTALLKAYEKLSSYNPSFKFFSWIYRIMVNESLDLLRQRRPSGPLDPRLASSSKDPEAEAREAELASKLRAAMSELTADQREVLQLRHYVDLSYAEMAKALGIAEKTVKSRLFSARRKLGELLVARGAVR